MEIPVGVSLEEAGVTDKELIGQQLAYYRARAPEYDQWFLRQGRYDRGPEHREEWFREVSTIDTALRPIVEQKSIVELACGTGLWTERVARTGARVLAVDAAPEAIAINRKRLGSPKVEYCVADIFSWTPPTTFDVVFFSFWLSHVPRTRFDEFWATVRSAIKPDGSAFFIDSLLEPSSTARDHDPPGASGVVLRKLNDGREFQIVKVFYEPAALEHRLSVCGWQGWVRSAGKFFLYGSMRPMQGGK